jgi:hypothetical protein
VERSVEFTAPLLFLLLHVIHDRIQHLPLTDILLMHEISELLLMILQHLHRRVVDRLLLHRVLARLVDVVCVMMNGGRIRRGRSVSALMPRRGHSLMHAFDVRVHSIDVLLHHLFHDFVPVGGLQLSFGELLQSLLLLPHHSSVLPSVVRRSLALTQNRFVLNLIAERLLDEVKIDCIRPCFLGDLLYFDLLLVGVGRVLLLFLPHLRLAAKARYVERVEEDQRTPVRELELFFTRKLLVDIGPR